MSENENRFIQDRLAKLKDIRDMSINPYPYSFDQENHAKDILEKYPHLKAEEKTDDKVKIAGRVMQLRRMGKASFAHLMDESGKIQIYFNQGDIGEESYSVLKKTDIGDIIGVEGIVFKTKTGEITVYASSFKVLCKTIQPLPEKYHGLKDTELRYRMRYLDLIMNPEVRETFRKRSAMITAIRDLLNRQHFMEVETPILQPIYGGASARPFKTFHNTLKMDLYLKISPELYLKRLVVGGFEKVYDLNKNFRNEGIDTTHNPEFTMMEIYQAYADYNDMMKLTEDIYEHVAKTVFGTTKFKFNEHEIDVKTPWRRLPMKSAIKEYAGIDVDSLSDEELLDTLRSYNIEYEGDFSRGLAIQLIFEELCEDKLIQPTFITDHPKESTPLCKQHRENPELIERFEPYILGWEIGNGYSELNDPVLQRQLLEKQAEELRGGAEEAHPMDEDFVKAIEYGLPPTGGVGISIDRMAMIMTSNGCIRDVLLFPTMKPDYATVEEQDKGLKEDIKRSLE